MANEHGRIETLFPSVLSVDGRQRVLDFLSRHGGATPHAEHEGSHDHGEEGWSEVQATDGHRLRCEWSLLGEERHMSFIEIPPQSK